MTPAGDSARYDPGRHYDRVTHAWTLLLGDDLHYGLFESGGEDLAVATRRLTDAMVDAADLRDGVEVLDVGCGTGAPACRLALEHGARVTGITTSAVGVEAAAGRAATLGADPSTLFLRRDGMDNGFADASFDRVWVLESSHLMRSRERLLAECARVLRPGGRLTLCDVMLRRPMPFEEVRRLRVPLMLLRQVFGDARMEPLSRYVELAGANGLTVDRQVDLTRATRPTFEWWRRNAHLHHDEVVATIGAAELERFVDASDVLDRLWDDGTLGYGLLAAARP